MKAMPASEFKEHCLSLLDHLDADGLVITRDGKPIARLVRYLNNPCGHLIGSMKGLLVVKGDVFTTGARWDAQS